MNNQPRITVTGAEERTSIFPHARERLVLLVDASGRRGGARAEWPLLKTRHAVGFAGGLGPDALCAELPPIRAVARPGWWVDMEGRLRDEG